MAYISCHFYSRYLAHQTQICLALPASLTPVLSWILPHGTQLYDQFEI